MYWAAERRKKLLIALSTRRCVIATVYTSSRRRLNCEKRDVDDEISIARRVLQMTLLFFNLIAAIYICMQYSVVYSSNGMRASARNLKCLGISLYWFQLFQPIDRRHDWFYNSTVRRDSASHRKIARCVYIYAFDGGLRPWIASFAVAHSRSIILFLHIKGKSLEIFLRADAVEDKFDLIKQRWIRQLKCSKARESCGEVRRSFA